MTDVTEAMSYLVSPDAWIKIPEFGVMPAEVNYEGFSFPVIHHPVNKFGLNLMRLIGVARQLAQREFKTLNELQETYGDALGVMIDDDRIKWSGKQWTATVYSMFMQYIEAARAPVPSSPFNISSIEALSEAAMLILNWTTQGAKAASKLYSQAQANRRVGKTKLSDSEKKQVLREYNAAVVKYGTIKSLAGKFNVSDDTISRIVKKSTIKKRIN